MEIAKAPLTGLEPSAADTTDFYAVTLGGNAARVVVRDWYQAKFSTVRHRLRSGSRSIRVTGQHRPPALWQLLAALEPPGSVPASRHLLRRHSGTARCLVGERPSDFSATRFPARVPPKPKDGPHLLQQRIALIKLTLSHIWFGGHSGFG